MIKHVQTVILLFTIFSSCTTVLAAGNGYAWANRQDATEQYQPNTRYSWNSAGGEITAILTVPGEYTISFADLGGNGTPGGHAQVSAYGAGNGYCKVSSWDSKSEDFIVNIHCFDHVGQPANSQFVVRVGWPEKSGVQPAITPENSRFFDSPDNIMSTHQTRSIANDGHIVINYFDGRIMERFFGGSTTILPNGQKMTSLQVEKTPDIPAGKPSNTEKIWLLKHNENLYEIIKHLVNNDEQALENYRDFEGRNKSVYDTIAIRQKTISLLTRP